MDLDAQDQRSFLVRVLRIIAILCFTYGLFDLITVIMRATRARYSFFSGGYGARDSIYRMLQWAYLARPTAQMIGGWGLLRWKKRGRRILIVWAWLTIGFELVANVMNFYYMPARSRITSSTRPTSDRFFLAWGYLATFLPQALFPLIVLLILIQPKVRELWSRRERGFEVLPIETL